MIEVEKVYSDNPFVDEAIYYSKLLALNCVVKDKDEALESETPDSLKAGDAYIACIEGYANYEMFSSFPQEILEKYIESKSNLDLMVENPNFLQVYLDSFSVYDRQEVLNRISKIAATTYIDHYDIMYDYAMTIGDDWLGKNEDLYNSCVDESATYKTLFEAIPKVTRRTIIDHYITNFDNTDFDVISDSIENFQNYIGDRTDPMHNELDAISKAMRDVFKSHYEVMKVRDYLSVSTKDFPEFDSLDDVYELCATGRATYIDLYPCMPASIKMTVLSKYFPEEDITSNQLDDPAYVYLSRYLEANHVTPEVIATINKDLSYRYMAVYSKFMNYGIYSDCTFGNPTYFDLVEYLPKETKKVILNVEIEEVTNIEIYSQSKEMLNSYFETLEPAEVAKIKANIISEMKSWYPKNYKETNNYYRTYIGLPPMTKDGFVYKDTLTSTYDALSGTYINFGDKFINMIPSGIYPELHWRSSELCEFDAYDVSILLEYGVIDAYLEECDTSDPMRYRYLSYLGDRKLDIYICRKADAFDLISVPVVDNTAVRKKFIDKYAINRSYIMHNIYSDAYKFQSDYYNKFIIVFALTNTVMDVLTEIPRFIINKEIFDSRSIKCLFESNGIPYYSEIPVKYQRAMLQNMNTLIKYKSSTKNMIDICSLFGFDDIRVFRYYLLKERVKDSNTGAYVFSKDYDMTYDLNELYVIDPNGEHNDLSGVHYSKLLEYRNYREDKYAHTILVRDDQNQIYEKKVINDGIDCYIKDPNNDVFIPLRQTDYFTKIKENIPAVELKFVKVPADGVLTDYKNDADYIVPYKDIVKDDDTWTGGLSDSYVENKIKDYNFNASLTKYISVETVTEMTELTFQVSFFYNMLFDNLYSEEWLTVEIPYIKANYKFKFMDIVCYLFALMYLYNELEDTIMYSPTQILYIKGYNFDESLNAVLQDTNSFTQTQNPMNQENIFDINEQIFANDYDYRKKFEDEKIRIQAFNLDADLDELDAWLSQYQMSLDDFIVDDSMTTFNQIITLRQFYSLNNSYYQKNIFTDGLFPSPYNQEIKYAFDCELFKKSYINDINGVQHEYIIENISNYTLVINDNREDIYIFDGKEYAITDGSDGRVLYLKYHQGDDAYNLDSVDYYTRDLEGNYSKLFDGEIFVRDTEGKYLLSADAYYTKGANDAYYEITRPDYFYIDMNLKRVIKLGVFYIQQNGKWILNPENCYVVVKQGDKEIYVLAKDVGEYENKEILAEDLYVQRNGSFIQLILTDFYHKNEDGTYTYDEDICFIKVDEETEYFDPVYPDVYYQKLEDYKTDTDYNIISGNYYVRDADGNFLKEKDLISPSNCYIKNLVTNQYVLAVDSYVSYQQYSDTINRTNVLILQSSNDFIRYALNSRGNYVKDQDENLRYVKNSQKDYVLILKTDATYLNTNQMIVVLNKEIGGSNNTIFDDKYNPERDNVWDENDWFYQDPGYDDSEIGMHGENIWYYRKPGSELPSTPTEEESKAEVASGFYLSPETYLGSVKIEKDGKYYLAFDLETNFTGLMQIACEADTNLDIITSMNYTVTAGQTQHITQVFTANAIERPKIVFFIYNYNEYPIESGDYIIISDIRLTKGHTNNYIPQDIPSYDKLQDIYRTNEAIYKFLVTKMEDCSDYRMYEIYKTLYDSLMVSKYNKEAFKIGENQYAKTYTEFLQTRDTVLYERLTYFRSLNTQTMQKEIADNIIEVAYAIDDCIDTYSYSYLYSYFPAVSANYIQQYISKIIEFFKSWKVHLLGVNTIYKFDDKLNNKVKILEDDKYKIKYNDTIGGVTINDSIKVNPMDDVDPIGNKYAEKYEDLVSVSNRMTDSCVPRDRVSFIIHTDNELIYKENNLILNLNDSKVDAYVDKNNNLIVSDGVFDVNLPNELIYNNDDVEHISTKMHSIGNRKTTQ